MSTGIQLSMPSGVQLSTPFSLEPPVLERNFITKRLENPTWIKTARYALWIFTFTCAGLAVASATLPYAVSLYLMSFALVYVALKVEALYDDLLCREFNPQFLELLGDLDQIPLIDPPEGKLDKIDLEHLTHKLAKGMLYGQPFIAVKGAACFYRDHALKWRRVKERPSTLVVEEEITIEKFKTIIH